MVGSVAGEWVDKFGLGLGLGLGRGLGYEECRSLTCLGGNAGDMGTEKSRGWTQPEWVTEWGGTEGALEISEGREAGTRCEQESRGKVVEPRGGGPGDL